MAHDHLPPVRLFAGLQRGHRPHDAVPQRRHLILRQQGGHEGECGTQHFQHSRLPVHFCHGHCVRCGGFKCCRGQLTSAESQQAGKFPAVSRAPVNCLRQDRNQLSANCRVILGGQFWQQDLEVASANRNSVAVSIAGKLSHQPLRGHSNVSVGQSPDQQQVVAMIQKHPDVVSRYVRRTTFNQVQELFDSLRDGAVRQSFHDRFDEFRVWDRDGKAVRHQLRCRLLQILQNVLPDHFRGRFDGVIQQDLKFVIQHTLRSRLTVSAGCQQKPQQSIAFGLGYRRQYSPDVLFKFMGRQFQGRDICRGRQIGPAECGGQQAARPAYLSRTIRCTLFFSQHLQDFCPACGAETHTGTQHADGAGGQLSGGSGVRQTSLQHPNPLFVVRQRCPRPQRRSLRFGNVATRGILKTTQPDTPQNPLGKQLIGHLTLLLCRILSALFFAPLFLHLADRLLDLSAGLT